MLVVTIVSGPSPHLLEFLAHAVPSVTKASVAKPPQMTQSVIPLTSCVISEPTHSNKERGERSILQVNFY